MSKPRIAEKIAHDHDEDQTLVGLKDHARFIKHIEPHYNPELFSPGAPRMVAEWCMAHWKKHHKPIRNLENRLTQYCIETKPDEGDKRLLTLEQTIGRLESLSDRQQRTTEELLVHAQRFLDRDYARAIGISETNRDGKLDKCMEAITKKKRIILGYDEPESLSDVEAERVDWLWKHWLAFGELIDLSGPPHSGKSTIAADWAARFTRGWTPPFEDGEEADEPGMVLWLGKEESTAKVFKQRFEAMGGNGDLLKLPPRPKPGLPEREMFITNPHDLTTIEYWIRKYKVRMMIFDPIFAFIGNLKVDSDRDPHVRLLLAPVLTLARTYNVCTILVRHWKKEKDNASNRALGSVAWAALPRIQHLAAQEKEGNGLPVTLGCEKTIGPKPQSVTYQMVGDEVRFPDPDHRGWKDTYDTWKVEWIGASTATANQIARFGNKQRGRPSDVSEFVRKTMKYLLRASGKMEGGKLIEAVMKITGCSERTCERMRGKIADKRASGQGKDVKYYYSLKPKKAGN
jgi:hypothetical protein